MNHDDLFKIDIGGNFLVCVEYQTGGRLLRVSSNDKPRSQLYVVASRVLAKALAILAPPKVKKE